MTIVFFSELFIYLIDYRSQRWVSEMFKYGLPPT